LRWAAWAGFHFRNWGGGDLSFLRASDKTAASTELSQKEQKNKASLQLSVLRLGFFQDGNVGVAVFPEGEKIFVGGECPDAGSIGVSALRGFRLQGVGTSHAQMR